MLAQEHNDTISYNLNARVNAGGGQYAPFLSTVNQYDRFSIMPNSLSVWGAAHKYIKNNKVFDYGFGVELDGNVGVKQSRFFPNELYVEGKFYFLNIFAGYKHEVYGNQDTELSSGGMLWSQNSRPIPKISIETNGFVDIPYTKGYVAVKGGLSHGWFNDNVGMTGLLLHQKYIAINLGGTFPVNLNYGLYHVAQWGGTSSYGTIPATLDNYLRIFMGKSGSAGASESDQINVLGNHIISQNLGLDIKFQSAIVSLYWQNLTEDPPIRFITAAPNVKDGLWGLSVKFPKFKLFNKFVVEYLSTTDQSGPWHDLDGVIFGGDDRYFYNDQIPQGWSYRGMTIGNPWLTSPKYNQDGSTTVMNDRVRLFYFSGKGQWKSLDYKLTTAYSENFGFGNPSFTNCKRQLSYQIETSTALKMIKNARVSLAISGDNGTMYGNNIAILAGFSYSGFFGF